MVPQSENCQFSLSDDWTSQHRPLCDTPQQQVINVCVTYSGRQGSSGRCPIEELGSHTSICISTVSHRSCSTEQDPSIFVQHSPSSSSVVSDVMVSRVTTTSCSSTHTCSYRSRPSESTMREILASKSSNACSSRLGIIKQSVRDKKFSRDIAKHVPTARRTSTKKKQKVHDVKCTVFASCCRSSSSYLGLS